MYINTKFKDTKGHTVKKVKKKKKKKKPNNPDKKPPTSPLTLPHLNEDITKKSNKTKKKKKFTHKHKLL